MAQNTNARLQRLVRTSLILDAWRELAIAQGHLSLDGAGQTEEQELEGELAEGWMRP